MTCLISVITYQRPYELARLLQSLSKAIGDDDAAILVVDNDPEGEAAKIVDSSPITAFYEIEPTPGIPSARNRCLDFFAGGNYSELIFVDDDEWVDKAWLHELLRFQCTTDVGVVSGPVLTQLPENAPRWMTEGKFYQRPIPPTGTSLARAATNNVLLTKKAWIDAGQPRFSSIFVATGGEDTHFFRTMATAGIPIQFCAEAIVYEDVPPCRLNFRWIARRARRFGNIDVVICSVLPATPCALFARSFAHAALASIMITRNAIFCKPIQATHISKFFYFQGVFLATLGIQIHYYRSK